MLHKKVKPGSLKASEESIAPLYSRHAFNETVARYDFSEQEMLPQTAYNLVHDELMLDGNARLNLATFVTTWMEPEARVLMAETFDKNMIDKDEYPQTAAVELRCVNMLARLWNSADHEEAVGCSTIGSSEAAMLGGLALKWRWRERRKATNQPADRPNLVMGINVQVCWDKFCRYFDVEPRLVPLAQGRYHLTAEEAITYCDENTIGVVAIMGSTYDGSYEPVKQINDALDALQREKGWDIPIHVDGASGGFIAPFLQPDLLWDFRVPRVQSINASGHKYGLVYPGVGWIIWRNQEALAEDLIFKVNYLGGEMPTFALNFSRPGSQVVAQYYNFLRLGKDGYRRVQQSCQDVALYLSGEIGKLGPFELLTEGRDIPVFAFKLKEVTNYTVFDLSERLRDRGWILPAYTFPPNLEHLSVLRVVVKDGFSREMADLLLDDLRRHLKFFASQPGYTPMRTGGGNNHGIAHEKTAASKVSPHGLDTGTATHKRSER
ncbi:MAG: glutamate decarboxylase [Chloroflexota bacterium]|nr:glutamate decarboxylase [Chloroflexota bacterium]